MIVAHGLFIDDLAWFVIPVVASLFVLRWAERRARERARADEDGQEDPDASV